MTDLHVCVQNGHKIVSKRENWQNRYFAVVDGAQPHIAWYKDQKVCASCVLCTVTVWCGCL